MLEAKLRGSFKVKTLHLSENRVSAPVVEARETEKRIIQKLNTTNKKQISDSSVLNSSWLYRGTWVSNTAQEDYWLDTLYLTTKIEKQGGRVTTIGKTYTYPNFPLTVWSLMKAALGRYGTGAGSVFWHAYIWGWKSGKEVKASRYSETAILNI